MINESKVLEVVKTVTDKTAYFFEGTLFVETTDSSVAVTLFNVLREKVTAALAFQRVGSETAYDFFG